MKNGFKLQEANPIKEQLAREAVNSVISQINDADDMLLIRHKNDTHVYVKLQVGVPKVCDRCGGDMKSIVDCYDFDSKGNLINQETFTLCKKCRAKIN